MTSLAPFGTFETRPNEGQTMTWALVTVNAAAPQIIPPFADF